MKLGKVTQIIHCEAEIQAAMEEYLMKHKIKHLREVYTPEVGRVADFLLINNNQLVNIEAKTNLNVELLNQLDDHAKYCAYVFALIPDFSFTAIKEKNRLSQNGYGLIVYNYNSGEITEVLEANYLKLNGNKVHKNTRKIYHEKITFCDIHGNLDLDTYLSQKH